MLSRESARPANRQAHCHEPPPDLKKKGEDVPAELVDLVQPLLAKKPEVRFASRNCLLLWAANVLRSIIPPRRTLRH